MKIYLKSYTMDVVEKMPGFDVIIVLIFIILLENIIFAYVLVFCHILQILAQRGYNIMYLQIPDWKFPFKNSYHPVCAYATRQPLMMRLRHCDPDVISGTELFHFMGAEDCKCKVKYYSDM